MKYMYNAYEMDAIIDTMEFGCPWSKILEFHERIKKSLLSIESVVFISTHISHIHRAGVGLYYTVAMDKEKVFKDYEEIWGRSLTIAVDCGCSISHHHGVGRVKSRYLKYEVGEEGIKLLKKIIQSLDEENLFGGVDRF